MDFYDNKSIIDFLDKFGDDFGYSMPDGLFIYYYNDDAFITNEEEAVKLAAESLEKNENLFLYLDRQPNPPGAKV